MLFLVCIFCNFLAMLQRVKIPDIVTVMAYRPAAWLGKLKTIFVL